MGPTAGGAVYSAMTDWVFMTKKSSYMFITGPDVINAVTGEKIDFESLGGAMTHNTKSGVAHFACESDAEAIKRIKDLLGYLPSRIIRSHRRKLIPKTARNGWINILTPWCRKIPGSCTI